MPDVGGSLEALADEVRVEAGDAGEYLVVRFASRSPELPLRFAVARRFLDLSPDPP